LATVTDATKIPKLQADPLLRLSTQRGLQDAKRRDGGNRVDVLPHTRGRDLPGCRRPTPAISSSTWKVIRSLAGGLEYLFGFVDVHRAAPRFTSFWGHDREREKRAFEAAMDFITARMAASPDAHVFHYAAYEETALKRLAMVHGTRETALEQFAAARKIDRSYRVVREAVRVSEPELLHQEPGSLLYAGPYGRGQDAGSSVVVYEQWRRMGEGRLLQEIADYNEVDCVSTLKLRDWLLTLRSPEIPWYTGPDGGPDEPDRTAEREAAEQRVAATIGRLLQVPAADKPFRELVGHLLEFHRREDKPRWWARFQWRDMSEEELIDDAECIGGLRRDFSVAPFKDKRSMVHTFTFAPQDFKIRLGSKPSRAATLQPAGEVVMPR